MHLGLCYKFFLEKEKIKVDVASKNESVHLEPLKAVDIARRRRPDTGTTLRLYKNIGVFL